MSSRSNNRHRAPILAVVLALGASGVVCARPISSPSDLAFAEEMEIACARTRPHQAAEFEKKKRALLAASHEQVEQARAARQYETFRGFARTVLEQLGDELPAACDKFLTQDDKDDKAGTAGRQGVSG